MPTEKDFRRGAIPRDGKQPAARAQAAFAFLVLLAAPMPSAAAVALQGLFSNHMVVQRDLPVPVFGAAAANEAVTVKLGTQQIEGKAGADGRFLVRLPAQPAGGPYTMTVTGTNTITLTDVYVGEVWIASGQSNIDYKVDCTFSGCEMLDEAKEIAAADYPLIRSINIERKGSATPQTSMTTKNWMVATPQTIGGFSAIGYFFARELHKNLPNVAIGILHASYGASCIECWMSKEALAGLPSFAPLLTAYERAPAHADQHNPYNCYNGQIFPIKPYAVRGAIWYQGESLTRGEATYRDLQVEMVKSWRREWGQDMTFIVAQLANHYKDTRPLLREAQMQGVLMVPNAGLSVNIDIGHATNVHPPNKQEAGLRMALAARAIAYKQPIHYSGPLYDRMAVEGSAIRVFFRHAEGGLLLKGAGNDTTFQVAGADGRFVPAKAVVDKDSTLLVSAASVAAPQHVRYAYTFNPVVTLYSKALPSLPASPFRSNGPAVPVFLAARPGAGSGAYGFHGVRGLRPGSGFFLYSQARAGRSTPGCFDARGRQWHPFHAGKSADANR